MTDQHLGLRRHLSEGSILLFGSLALSFDASTFKRVRRTIVESDENVWLADVVAALPDDCDEVLSALPFLHETTRSLARKQLNDLRDAFITGRPLDTAFPLPNSLLVPLVVIV